LPFSLRAPDLRRATGSVSHLAIRAQGHVAENAILQQGAAPTLLAYANARSGSTKSTQFKTSPLIRSKKRRVSTGLRKMIGEHDMPLVTILITVCVVGVLLWLVNRYIPMQGTIKGILNGIVVILLVVWLLKAFDLLHYVTDFRVGH
jgi:hypothetical protein